VNKLEELVSTPEKAVDLAIEQWTLIIESPARKDSAYNITIENHKVGPDSYIYNCNSCFLCDYIDSNNLNCSSCPLSEMWHDHPKNCYCRSCTDDYGESNSCYPSGNCEHPDSPYQAWFISRIESEKTSYAKAILELLK